MHLVREVRALLFLEFEGAAGWREMVDAVALREDPENVLYEASVGVFLAMHWGDRDQYQLYWNWVRAGRIQPEPVFVVPALPVARGLQALARDPQNVHTQAVSNQTNAAMDKLMECPIPKDQQTEKAMVRVWTSAVAVGWTEMLRTLNDVNKWFNTKTCRNQDDHLYRVLLRGLVATINQTDDEMKIELYKRLWEECRESVGMCCEGHITRLCNVMVGFDDAFKPQVSLGELIQQKMAAISGLEVEEEEKRRQANQWFDENNVAADDRTAWLEAF